MKKLTALFLLVIFFTFSGYGQYTFVFLNKKTNGKQLPENEVKKIMEGHMANMEQLAKEKKLLAAGPFEGGGGIFILNTQNKEEATQWLSTDPGVRANRWNVEVLPYQPRYGGICPVNEPYEMTKYTFVRFTPLVTKSTASTYPEIIKQHDDYVKQLIAQDSVVTEGIFGVYDGGILVMKGNVDTEMFESDPGVQQGLLEVDIKSLFIAKGSFCEH